MRHLIIYIFTLLAVMYDSKQNLNYTHVKSLYQKKEREKKKQQQK